MKVRNGFVSNSSSSSCIIIGFEVGDETNDVTNIIDQKLANKIFHENNLDWMTDDYEREYVGFYFMNFGEHPDLSIEELEKSFQNYQMNKQLLLDLKLKYCLPDIQVVQVINIDY